MQNLSKKRKKKEEEIVPKYQATPCEISSMMEISFRGFWIEGWEEKHYLAVRLPLTNNSRCQEVGKNVYKANIPSCASPSCMWDNQMGEQKAFEVH